MPAMHTVIVFVMVNGVRLAKTPVQDGHVALSKIYCSVGWKKYQTTCGHMQANEAIHFKCKEREV